MKRLAIRTSLATGVGVAALALSMVFSAAPVQASAVTAADGGASSATTANGHSGIESFPIFHGQKIHYAPASTNNLTYHGGKVETTPTVYIDWWGSQWSTGFSTGGFSSSTAQTYMSTFYSNVGGSSWDNIDTQYCQGVAVGTINCGTSGTHITNPTGQLSGTWNDTASSVPSRPTQSQIAAEAVKAAQHFGYKANATYIVFTPTGHSMSGFGTQWCAWHSETSTSSGPLAYAYMPYIPDAGASCGENFINTTNNSFGNGYFDGFSVVGGHEYAEAMTDPNTSSSSAEGWIDSSGAENGDKCAWASTSTNITLGSHFFAVQPIWNNANSGCVTSR